MAIKNCPYCKELANTKVIKNKYKQIPIQNGVVKRRKIIHRIEDGGCGQEWTTLEIEESILRHLLPSLFLDKK